MARSTSNHTVWLESIEGVDKVLTKNGHHAGPTMLNLRSVESVSMTRVLDVEAGVNVDAATITTMAGAMWHLVRASGNGALTLTKAVGDMVKAAR